MFYGYCLYIDNKNKVKPELLFFFFCFFFFIFIISSVHGEKSCLSAYSSTFILPNFYKEEQKKWLPSFFPGWRSSFDCLSARDENSQICKQCRS